MKYVSTEKVVIKSWCNEPEESAIEQAKNIANLPFIFKQVCLMPDTHQGYGMPIGGVAALIGAVSPNMVGVDIGCGMLSVRTSLTNISTDQLKTIMSAIRAAVPVGMRHHDKEQQGMPAIDNTVFHAMDFAVINDQYHSAAKQLGTLGGGNHFIEIQKGSDGFIYFMIHSGSRNLGKRVADHYNKVAVELNQKWFSSVPKEHELAFLPIDTKEAKLYLNEMDFCLRFALANRKLMANRISEAFIGVTGCTIADEINIHHNYARMENHFGKNVMIHRKGATSAKLGEIGLIPGSQGTNSYIVEGLGNPESFMSCSHGAGRKMSRSKAVKELDLEAEKKKLDDQGIIHGIRNKDDLEEACSAYKDIDVVMEEQKDLVKVLVKLSPLAVIKG